MRAENGVAESRVGVGKRSWGDGGGKDKIHAKTAGQVRQEWLGEVGLSAGMVDFIQDHHRGRCPADDPHQALYVEPPIHALPAVDIER